MVSTAQKKIPEIIMGYKSGILKNCCITNTLGGKKNEWWVENMGTDNTDCKNRRTEF